MSAGLRPIPRRLLPDSCTVRGRLADGSYGPESPIARVRFERRQSATPGDAHRSADAGAGTLYVDAVNSVGAFEIEAGSRVEVGGASLLATEVRRYEGANGRVHHWEVELR